jgi:uncharacterized membrane protein
VEYLVVKWIHILAAITAVGANITYGVWLNRARANPEALPFVLRGVAFLDSCIANPAYAVALVSGLIMVWHSGLPLTTPWLVLALALFIAATIVGVFVVTPGFQRQIQLAEAGGAGSPEYQAEAARGARIGIGLTLAVLVITLLMVFKPALW